MVTRRCIKSFAGDRRGNIAMMWAAMGAVLIGLVGVTVDFTRAQMLRAQMQNAVDGAALVAERSSNLSIAQRTAAARAFFDAEMGEPGAAATFNVVQMADGGHRVEADLPLDLSLARLVNNSNWNVHVEAEAQASASPPIEVALVLDNTGSMSNDMQALRDAASDLADDLLAIDGDSVHVALVPFVAQVNIGNQVGNRVWMDVAGTAPYNGELLEDRMIGYVPRNTTAATNDYRYTGSNCEALSTRPYFNVSSTAANEGYPGPYGVTWIRNGSYCYAFTPQDGINYFTLFDQIPNDTWKGCVEARPEPYDINDATPDPSDPSSMFVPFFWLDTGGTAGQSNSTSTSALNYRNNSQSYIADTPGRLYAVNNTFANNNNNSVPSGSRVAVTMSSGQYSLVGPTTQERREANFFNVFKYRGDAASITSTAPEVRGPNRGCPTPIVPLTTNSSTIQTAIAGMRHWSGGGTNQAEGLAWGWRVLSPTAPFTQGETFNAARDNVRKVIVLMSDGENATVGTDAVMTNDYSAYNHIGFWSTFASGNLLTQILFGVLHGILPDTLQRELNDGSNISNSTTYLRYVNQRQAMLCTNIKNAGIEIYVVRFRNGDASIMRDCATQDGEHYYEANSASELAAAFDAIGTGIGSLRLTR